VEILLMDWLIEPKLAPPRFNDSLGRCRPQCGPHGVTGHEMNHEERSGKKQPDRQKQSSSTPKHESDPLTVPRCEPRTRLSGRCLLHRRVPRTYPMIGALLKLP